MIAARISGLAYNSASVWNTIGGPFSSAEDPATWVPFGIRTCSVHFGFTEKVNGTCAD